jgi:hypothetical protein
LKGVRGEELLLIGRFSGLIFICGRFSDEGYIYHLYHTSLEEVKGLATLGKW